MTDTTLSRRGILSGVLGAGAVGLNHTAPATAAVSTGSFTHNVASGDPLATRVILWTRFVPVTGRASKVKWEIGTDDTFSTIVKHGTAPATAAADFTIKVDAGGLTQNTKYAYRFRSGDAVSPTGYTRTLPTGDVSQLKLGVFSCSNLPFGYFHAYRHAVERGDIDVALHLGDYIYEYQRGSYPSARDAMADRVLEPATEIISLTEYRQRYASYRIDPDLQEVHRKLPFITVWDDHELANDTWRGGAQNHQPETEGPWAKRRAAAIKAYYEWMPIRVQKGDKTYRRFDFGRLASLIMLDTREIGRDKQLDYKTDLALQQTSPRPEELDTVVAAFRKKWLDPKRSLLGVAQENWFAAQVKDSAAKNIRWQVIGQQLQTGYMMTPKDLPAALPADAPDWLRTRVELGALMSTKGLPANLDAWNGYPAARSKMIDLLADNARNAIILAGDTHNAWLFELGEAADNSVAAVEFGGHSVSSPGYESAIKIAPETLKQMLTTQNPELKWCNVAQRGYMVTTFTADAATNEWIFLDGIREKTFAVASTMTARVLATDGKGTAKAVFTPV
jgi:alkaline phosphatase D